MKINVKLDFDSIIKKYGLVFIDIYINNNKAKMLLDSGSTDNVIDVNFLKSININSPMTKKSSVNCFNSEKELEISELEIKNISIENSFNTNIKFTVVDMGQTVKNFKDDYNLDVVGLLGNVFLIKNNIIVNYKNNFLEYESDN